jgi:hypothetical protein
VYPRRVRSRADSSGRWAWLRQKLGQINGGLQGKVMFHIRLLAPILSDFCQEGKILMGHQKKKTKGKSWRE